MHRVVHAAREKNILLPRHQRGRRANESVHKARVALPRDAVIGETDRCLFGPGPARDQLPRRPDEVAPRPLCEVACAPTRLQAVLAPASWNTIGLVRA
jgi:hypothetical protein